jgi:truncated hemoglobin YjbI
MKPIIGVIVDGEQVFREMTDAEHADYEIEQAERLAWAKAKAKAETDKANAKQAVLDRLGITADEAALLLG